MLNLSIDYYAQFKAFGDSLASERCTERQLRATTRNATSSTHARSMPRDDRTPRA